MGIWTCGLWGAADELRANSKLKAAEYSVPVLGLIFLRFVDNRFAKRLYHVRCAEWSEHCRRIGDPWVSARGLRR